MRNSTVIKSTIFITLTFIFTIILAVVQQSLNIDYKYITLPQWGPGIAAIILGFLVYKNIIGTSIKFRGLPPTKLLICLLLPIGMIGAGYFINKALSLTTGSIGKLEIQLLYVIIPSCFFGAVGEVLGWRCFLQKSLDGRMNYLRASIVTGTLWGLWHVGHYSTGVAFMFLFLIFTISFSFILAYLIRELEYNFLLAALFHFSTNMGFFIFYRENSNDTNMMLINALIWLSGAIFILISTSKGFMFKSSYKQR